MKKCISNILCFLFFTFLINSAITAQKDYISGFRNETRGTNFTYHSPYSHNEQSLLSRANKDFDAIEWETAKIPGSFENDRVSFIWLYGIDVLSERQDFDFFVNGKYILTFSNPVNNKEEIWAVEGKNDCLLTFNRAMIDKHGDQMGYAVLNIPANMVSTSEPVKIKVDGRDNNSNAWYMTFKLPLKSEFTAYQLKTVSKENDQFYYTIRFEIIHLGHPINSTITVNNISKEFKLRTGLNEIDFPVTRSEKPILTNAMVEIGNNKWQQNITLQPIKEWTIHLVQHSHTDIGYTRPQSEILAEHLRYIDDALDYCDQTDHYPLESQFRWTCEAAWTVREYLNSRPESQISRLLQRIKEGRIEVTGMFFNFSEIVDETALAIQMQTLNKFKNRGIDVNTAMQNDVNGIGWCMVDLYHNTGVKYLTMGQHGHRARIPFNKPTSFWWESPSGNRLLAYRSEHYMHGNTLSLTSGNIDVFGKNLSKYLTELEEKDYPFNRIALQFSGYITDNSPPSTRVCDIVRKWNEKYEWPKLKLSLASEFMIHIDSSHSDHLETRKVAWPDWWTDGFGSAMNETKVSRITHSEMIATMGLLAMAKTMGASISPGIYAEITECYDNLLFYDEHTFGAAESISDPTSENSVNQWRQKSSYVWSANQQSNLLREKAIGLIQPYVKRTIKPSVTVFNTLNWSRSGIADVFIDHDILPANKEYQITDSKGNIVHAQLTGSRSEGSYWSLSVNDIPPMGYATFNIQVFEKALKRDQVSNVSTVSFENEFYKLVIDTNKNGIVSLYDKQLSKELLDTLSDNKFGSMIYELPENRTDLERLTYLNRDTVYRPISKEIVRLSDFRITGVDEGHVWKSIQLNGKLAGCADHNGVNMEIRLYHHTKKIELLYSMNKLKNKDPEGLYVAFPFVSENGTQLAFESQGGVVYPGVNQLEGTASDWNTIQNFATVINPNSQIVFCSNDIPLVQFGEINTGRFYYLHKPVKNHIYSWVLNNYWTTNFKASQEGQIKWKYQLTSTKDNSLSFATRFGFENRVPLIARTNSGNADGGSTVLESIINLYAPENLLLVNARPLSDGKNILFHFRETEGDHAILDISRILQNPNILSISEVNGLGNNGKILNGPLLIEHFETKFLLFEVKD